MNGKILGIAALVALGVALVAGSYALAHPPYGWWGPYGGWGQGQGPAGQFGPSGPGFGPGGPSWGAGRPGPRMGGAFGFGPFGGPGLGMGRMEMALLGPRLAKLDDDTRKALWDLAYKEHQLRFELQQEAAKEKPDFDKVEKLYKEILSLRGEAFSKAISAIKKSISN